MDTQKLIGELIHISVYAGRYATDAFSSLYLNGPDKIRTCDLVLIRDAL